MLAKRIRSYRDHEALLQRRIDELVAEKESVSRRREAAEELYEGEFGPSTPDALLPPEAAVRTVELGPLTGLSWAEAMTRVLQEAERPLHVKEIWQRLQEGGFRTNSRDPVRSVVAIAVRDPGNFPRAGPNCYGLATAAPLAAQSQKGGGAEGLFD